MTDTNAIQSNIIRISDFLGQTDPSVPEDVRVQATEALKEISNILDKISKVLQDIKQ